MAKLIRDIEAQAMVKACLKGAVCGNLASLDGARVQPAVALGA
jgi:hypothetical protein